MRSALILFCVALQLGVLGYMVYGRESVVGSGHRIYIATAPIDPRDPFRGDFVRLRYRANDIDSAPVELSGTRDLADRVSGNTRDGLNKGDILYAVLEQMPGGLYQVARYTDALPQGGLFMRGRIVQGSLASRRRSLMDIRYGIEQLFVQQGGGIEIEEKQGVRGGLQTAMEVEVALDKKGTAVITGYRWSELGIKLELSDSFRRSTSGSDSSTGGELAGPHIILQIQNVSDKPVTLNNPGDNCGFRLQPSNRDSSYREADNACSDLDTFEPLTLAASQTHRIDIDLTDPRWLVTFTDNGTTSTGDLRQFDDNEMFRIVYQSAAAGGKPLSEYWLGDLLSQGFNSRGRID